jgi:hypothetical protein
LCNVALLCIGHGDPHATRDLMDTCGFQPLSSSLEDIGVAERLVSSRESTEKPTPSREISTPGIASASASRSAIQRRPRRRVPRSPLPPDAATHEADRPGPRAKGGASAGLAGSAGARRRAARGPGAGKRRRRAQRQPRLSAVATPVVGLVPCGSGRAGRGGTEQAAARSE